MATPQKRSPLHEFIKRYHTILVVGVVAAIILMWILLTLRSGGDLEAAREITALLQGEGVPIMGLTPRPGGFEVLYAAESGDRFDDALIHDWGMIYGTVAAFECEEVSIVTTLDGEPFHRQSVSCEAVRAFARGVLNEAEFLLLVEHRSLA